MALCYIAQVPLLSTTSHKCKQLIQNSVTVGQTILEFKWEMYTESKVISVAYFYHKERH
jgi:hypothetical protein